MYVYILSNSIFVTRISNMALFLPLSGNRNELYYIDMIIYGQGFEDITI